jgi:hypothetical protein
MRGNKYVFSEKTVYSPLFKTYVNECVDTSKEGQVSVSFIPTP